MNPVNYVTCRDPVISIELSAECSNIKIRVWLKCFSSYVCVHNMLEEKEQTLSLTYPNSISSDGRFFLSPNCPKIAQYIFIRKAHW